MSEKVKLVKGSVRVDFPVSVDPVCVNVYDKIPREAFVKKLTIEYEIDPPRHMRELAAFYAAEKDRKAKREKGGEK